MLAVDQHPVHLHLRQHRHQRPLQPLIDPCHPAEGEARLQRRPEAPGDLGLLRRVTGGVLGSMVGGGRGQVLGAVVGALGGAAAGAMLEEGVTKKNALEITVELDSGEILSVVQEADLEFYAGERVRVLRANDGTSRVQK